MPREVKIWTVEGDGSLVTCESSQLDLEEQLEQWLEEDVSILDPELLVIGRQIPTDVGGVIDLLCLDPAGNVVVIELKRGRTPRDVVAQALDYAAWARSLSHEQISAIADQHLRSGNGLEAEFARRFDVELPETLNEAHRMVIVGADIDGRTERLVDYLSEEYGVDINVATFRVFTDASGTRLLSRVFLLPPSQVEISSVKRRGSKRRRAATMEELERVADDAAVGDLFRSAVGKLRSVFDYVRTTVSSVAFKTKEGGNRRVLFNLLPGDSDADRGVHFQIYWKRACEVYGLAPDAHAAILPVGYQPWAYDRNADENWRGYAGHLRSVDDIDRLVTALQPAVPQI